MRSSCSDARRRSTRRRGSFTSSPRRPSWTSATSSSSSRSERSRARFRSRGWPSTASASSRSPTRSTCATTSCASSRPPRQLRTARSAHLTFVFVGAGYAGVEALAELSDLVRDALRFYPELKGVPQRWVLVDAAASILPEIPRGLGAYAAKQLARRGVDIRVSTTLESVDADGAVLSDGTRFETHTLVWTAGVKANPLLGELGPAARRARARRRRADAPGRRARERLGARRLRARPQRGHARPAGPADVPACAPAGPAAREEPEGRAEALPLPDARPGGDPRPLQGDRRRARHPPARVPRLVRHPHVPPLPAPARLAQAARRRRLDGGALLPPGHRRALDARQARPSGR